MASKHSSRSTRKASTTDVALWVAVAAAMAAVAWAMGWEGAEMALYLIFLVLSIQAVLDLLTWTRQPSHAPTLLFIWLPIAVALAVWLAVTGQLLLLLTLFCLAPWLAIAALVASRVYRHLLRWQAKGGKAAAQFRLAEAYYYGDGFEEDLKAAVHWYHLAAQQRHSRAARQLSHLYKRGEGVPKNRRLADEWREVSHG